MSAELVPKQFVMQSKLDMPRTRKHEVSESEPETATVIDIFTERFKTTIVKYLKHFKLLKLLIGDE